MSDDGKFDFDVCFGVVLRFRDVESAENILANLQGYSDILSKLVESRYGSCAVVPIGLELVDDGSSDLRVLSRISFDDGDV